MASPILRCTEVRSEYADGGPGLRDVSFCIDASMRRTALLGANGAGKSSLFLAAGGFLPFRGAIELLGTALDARSAPELRRRAGFVFERAEDQLFLESIEEDTAFGPRNLGLAEPAVRERVARALDAVGLAGYGDRHPRRLSQGERRLASIATVLSMEPELLILDEPTANLDLRSRRRVLDVIDAFRGALLLLTHDLDAAAAHCDHAVVLAEGRVAASGSMIQILRDGPALAALDLRDEPRLLEQLRAAAAARAASRPSPRECSL